MDMQSPKFKNSQQIPETYACSGENINPPLIFNNVPKEAVSLVLIMDDPDAPKGLWVHWLLWNINPDTKIINENQTPNEAVSGITDFGQPGYGGPSPPSGIHRYFFKLYALDTKLNLTEETDKTELEKAMQGHIIDRAELIGLYSKNKNPT